MRIERSFMAARVGAALLTLAALPTAAGAQDNNVALVHKLLLAQEMVVQRGGEGTPATLGQRLLSGDLVITSANTRAAIRFTDDGSLVRLNPGSRLTVRTTGARDAVEKTLELEFGELWARVTAQQRERGFQVQTPSGVAAVKGTVFVVRVDAQGNTTVLTFDGAVDFFNNAGLITIEGGRKASSANNNDLGELEDITDEDRAQLGALIEDEADDDVIRVEVPVQNAEGVLKTVIMELPRGEAGPIVNPGGGQ
jgi:ferric-dicitrate binding protein FerR (iron transport regulator)